MNDKYKVGRPKLASDVMKKKAFGYLVFAIVIMFGLIFSFVNNTNILNTNNIKGAASGGKPFIPPLNGRSITTPYGKRGSMWHARGYHTGSDYGGGTRGMTIYPIGSGTVYCVSCKGKSFGNHVIIKHPNGYYSLYAHMSGKPYVKSGQHVNIATKLGKVGSTGNVTGPHLHLELWTGIPWQSKDVNPASYIDHSQGKAGTCTLKITHTENKTKYNIRYEYRCNNTARVKDLVLTGPGKNKKLVNNEFSSYGTGAISIDKLKKNKTYKLVMKYYKNPRGSKFTTKLSKKIVVKANGEATKKKSSSGSSSVNSAPKLNSSNNTAKSVSKTSVTSIKKLKAGKCPASPSITGILSNGTYSTNKFTMSVNTSGLTQNEINNIYVVRKTYSMSKTYNYTLMVNKKGKTKSKKEVLGAFDDGVAYKLKDYFEYKNGKYIKNIDFNTYHNIVLYAGSTKCYNKFFVTDGVTLKDGVRNYNMLSYNILTTKGIVKGAYTNSVIKSSDTSIIKQDDKDKNHFTKLLFMNANTNASGKVVTMTIKNNNLTGSFKTQIPDRHIITGYFLNPLTGKNDKISNKELSKAKNTKDAKGNTIYGVEFTKNPKTNKKLKVGDPVYAMDSGTVSTVRNKESSKDTYGYIVRVRSTTSSEDGEKFIHSYAHLGKVYVKDGVRVHKGQLIGTVGKSAKKGKNLKNPTLFVTVDHINKNNNSEVLLLSNFVGRNLRYGVVTKADNNYKIFQKYLTDKQLSEYQ